jgi:hypothetical protein
MAFEDPVGDVEAADRQMQQCPSDWYQRFALLPGWLVGAFDGRREPSERRAAIRYGAVEALGLALLGSPVAAWVERVRRSMSRSACFLRVGWGDRGKDRSHHECFGPFQGVLHLSDDYLK